MAQPSLAASGWVFSNERPYREYIYIYIYISRRVEAGAGGAFGAPFGQKRPELPRGCRSRFAATPLWGRCDHFGSRRRHDGLPRSPTETDPLCHRRTPLRISRRGDRVIRWQLPADAILRGFEPMSDADMPSEHLAEKPALEADDMVVLHRSPDRDSRHQRCRRRRRRALDEATERTMHRRNQSRNLINADTILRDITPDNLRDQAEINHLRGAFIGHIFYPDAV